MKHKTYWITPDTDLSKLTPENFMDYMEEAGEIEIIEIDKEEREELDSLVKAGEVDVIEIDPDCDDCAYWTEGFETPTICPECKADQTH